MNPESTPPTAAGLPRRNLWIRWGILLVIGVGIYGVLKVQFADSALRKDLRHAMGVEKGDDGFKPRAFSQHDLPPMPPELIAKLKAAQSARIRALIAEHFDSMVDSRDWHVMDERAVLRRIRALDLVTSLGLVQSVEPQIRKIAEFAATGANYYANNPAVIAEGETTATPPLSQLRDRQYYSNAVRLREAAKALIR